MLSVVTGCGFSDWVRNPFGDDEDPRAPAELLDVVSETTINRNWRINVGNGQGDNYKKLTPVVDGGFVFAASDDGEIIAVNTINGDLMWQTEVENSITGGVGAGDGIVMIGTEAAELIVFNQSNSVASFANGAFDQANGVASFANGAFNRSNSSFQFANTIANTISSSFIQANLAFDKANSAVEIGRAHV